MDITDLPKISFDKVYHVGDLNPNNERRIRNSLEGNALSVSVNPDAWTKIVKLGGRDTFEIESNTGALVFVHMLDLMRKKKFSILKNELVDLAVSRNYLQKTVAFKSTYYDDELGSSCYTLHKTSEEAAENGESVRKCVIYTGTPEFCQTMRLSFDNITDVADLGIMQVLKDGFLRDIDGVWWNEKLDPDCYSAPRGALFFAEKEFNTKQVLIKQRLSFR
jgi:hypothetical protein